MVLLLRFLRIVVARFCVEFNSGNRPLRVFDDLDFVKQVDSDEGSILLVFVSVKECFECLFEFINVEYIVCFGDHVQQASMCSLLSQEVPG